MAIIKHCLIQKITLGSYWTEKGSQSSWLGKSMSCYWTAIFNEFTHGTKT